MLPLESPRWKEFRHGASQSAQDIPHLLKQIAAENEPSYSVDLATMRDNPTAWEQVYGSLCHQYSIYSATYAALPHLVAMAETGSLGLKVNVLLLSGTIAAFGTLEDVVPEDLLQPFILALSKIEKISLDIVREAVAQNLHDRYPLACLLQAVLALQFGPLLSVRALDSLVENNNELETECPHCQMYLVVNLSDRPKQSITNSNSIVTIVPDREKLAQELSCGLLLINQKKDDWPRDKVVEIGSALAKSLGDERLSHVILNLYAAVKCPGCSEHFQVVDGLFDD